jgi:hypothetical protein
VRARPEVLEIGGASKGGGFARGDDDSEEVSEGGARRVRGRAFGRLDWVDADRL